MEWGSCILLRAKGGHFIQFEQPELMRRMVVAFLLDQPEPIAPYTSESDPRNANP
jgi:hypothetical protein